MTSDDLRLLIERGPTEKLVAALAPLTEAERKVLAKGAVELRKVLSRLRKEQDGQPWRPPGPCPFCGKLLRSGSAKQCFECGKDWHEPKDENRDPLTKWDRPAEARLNLVLQAHREDRPLGAASGS